MLGTKPRATMLAHMQIDHYIMLAVLICFSAFWAAKRQWFALGAALVSQVPFWIGSLVFFFTAVTPIQVNIITDLSVSGFFVFLAYRYRQMWLIWMAIVFLIMGIADVYASLFGMLYYFELHVALHLAALAVVAGRNHVDRVDRPMRDPSLSPQD